MKTTLLLVVCGLLELLYGVFYAFSPEHFLSLRLYLGMGTLQLLSRIAVTAGAAAVLAVLLELPERRLRSFAMHGLALAAIGLIGLFWGHERLRFLPVALLLVAMAVSLAIVLLKQQGIKIVGQSIAAASILFACLFIVLGMDWFRLEPQAFTGVYASFFLFSGACTLFFGWQHRSPRAAARTIILSPQSA